VSAPSRRRGWRVEEGGRNAWPALNEVFLGGWLLRFANGLSRRANSANPLHRRPQAGARLFAEIAALYKKEGRPAIFRLPSLIAPESEKRLDALGYPREGESVVLWGAIAGVKAREDPLVRLSSEAGREWFAAMARLQGYTEEEAATYRAILGRIALPAAFAAVAFEGGIVALAYGVLHRDLLRVQSMITDPRRRRSGFARRILWALAAWGKSGGAAGLSLEVDAANAPALALYRAFGIGTELYRYHYRRAPQQSGDRRGSGSSAAV
jgi:N-acetylglutamate synthase